MTAQSNREKFPTVFEEFIAPMQAAFPGCKVKYVKEGDNEIGKSTEPAPGTYLTAAMWMRLNELIEVKEAVAKTIKDTREANAKIKRGKR